MTLNLLEASFGESHPKRLNPKKHANVNAKIDNSHLGSRRDTGPDAALQLCGLGYATYRQEWSAPLAGASEVCP